MARIPRVTRTITTTEANVLCLNLETQQPFYKKFLLPRTFKSDEKILKAVKKRIDCKSVRAVYVESTDVRKVIYKMTEQKFIDNAEEKVFYSDVETCKECEINY